MFWENDKHNSERNDAVIGEHGENNNREWFDKERICVRMRTKNSSTWVQQVFRAMILFNQLLYDLWLGCGNNHLGDPEFLVLEESTDEIAAA